MYQHFLLEFRSMTLLMVLCNNNSLPKFLFIIWVEGQELHITLFYNVYRFSYL